MDTQRGEQRVALDVVGDVGFGARPPRRDRSPRVAACTRPGRGRDRNEDAVCARPDQGIYLVADGMGGHRGARRAARLTAAFLPRAIDAAVGGVPARDGAAFRAAIAATLARFSRDLRALDEEMGATVVVAVVRGERVFLAHLGDSRAHRFRAGTMRALTRDHTVVQALVDEGRLDVLSAALHPARGTLLRYLGMPHPIAAVRSIRVRPGDRLVLTSDGVHGLLPCPHIERLLAAARGPEAAARAIVDGVAARGGRDDASALVIDW